MSSVRGPSPSPSPVSSAQLRQMLEQALPNDAQLEAFCMDYAPTVHRQFSDGMVRTRKLNLLLEVTPTEELVEHLCCHAAAALERERTEPAVKREPQDKVLRKLNGGRVALGVFGVGIGVVISALLLRLACERPAPSGAAGTAGDSSTQIQQTASTIPTPWLTSEPSSALIYAMPAGFLLGQTPWPPEPALPWATVPKSGLQVCLRRAGFVPALVRLEPEAEPSRHRTIHVRLQQEPRAATQRDLKQEPCNVPTPILE